MRIPIRRGCMLLLTLPIVSLADPVSVTTHSSGDMTADETVMAVLGLGSLPSGATLPYALTFTSSFDPETNRANWISHIDDKVTIDFRIGSQVYHYEGIAYSQAFRYDQSIHVDAYEHNVWLNTPGPSEGDYLLRFSHTLYNLPRGETGTRPLFPYYADAGDGATGYATVFAYPNNPDVSLRWEMPSNVAALSVQVGVVPEPAAFALMAAGLLTLGLRRFFSVQEGSSHCRDTRKP